MAENNQQSGPPASGTRQEKSLVELLGISAGVLAVLATAAVYAAGAAYRTGYLYQFGFDSTQIPSDFHDTLYWGYTGGTPLAIAWMICGTVSLLLLALIYRGANALWNRIQKRPAVRQLSKKISAAANPSAGTHVKLVAVAVLVACTLYLVFLSYVAIGEIYESGVKKGKNRIAAFESDPRAAAAKTYAKWIEISFVSPAPRVERGYRLLCTDQLCSIYDPSSKQKGVRLISLEGMTEIRILEAPPKLDRMPDTAS